MIAFLSTPIIRPDRNREEGEHSRPRWQSQTQNKFEIQRGGKTFWVYNPWLDMIVGCGAWSAPLLLLAYFSLASNTLRWSIAFYGLALLFNYPHYMATIYRAYHRAEEFHKYRIFTVLLPCWSR